jgi:hypothetical protein
MIYFKLTILKAFGLVSGGFFIYSFPIVGISNRINIEISKEQNMV